MSGPQWWPEELEAAQPPERINVSEWAERYRVLTNAASKGPYQCDIVPPLVPIMDLSTVQDVETIVLCKPAQIGGTDGILNIIGYHTHQDPSPIMLVMADQDTAIDEMSRKRLQPMFKESPDLKRIIDAEEWTKRELSFLNGARITMAWASSVARLASRPFRIVALDEIDKPGYQRASDEADPVSLARERTNTFLDRLILLLSTPTVETGRIWRELGTCDVIFDWHVPCPHCGQYQPLRWSAEYASGVEDGHYRGDDGEPHSIGCVVWEGGREATREQINRAGYMCGECGSVWSTAEKNAAVSLGKMVPRTETTGEEVKVGFHLNRLYSLFPGGRIEKMVAEWIDAVQSGDPKQLQGFINSSLAEPWRQVTVSAQESEILRARTELPPQTVPEEAVALAAGIDQQKYGFWYVVRAWARDYTSWLIDYGFLPSWQDLEGLLFETAYPVQESDEQRTIWRAALDIGGGEQESGVSMTEEAYWWLRRNGRGRGCRVWAVKGSSHPMQGKVKAGKPLDKTPSGKPIPGGLQIVTLDTDELKNTYHYRLQQAVQGEGEPQAAYLHENVGEDYARQIKAQERRLDRQGREQWEKVGQDDHLIDCEVYCHAVVDPEWPGGGIQLLRPGNRPTQKKKKKSSKMNPYTQGENPFVR